MAESRPGTLAAFGSGDFRLLWGGQANSWLGIARQGSAVVGPAISAAPSACCPG